MSDEIKPECQWVLRDEGYPTIKFTSLRMLEMVRTRRLELEIETGTRKIEKVKQMPEEVIEIDEDGHILWSPKRFVAYGPGYSGAYSSLEEAEEVVKRNRIGNVCELVRAPHGEQA